MSTSIQYYHKAFAEPKLFSDLQCSFLYISKADMQFCSTVGICNLFCMFWLYVFTNCILSHFSKFSLRIFSKAKKHYPCTQEGVRDLYRAWGPVVAPAVQTDCLSQRILCSAPALMESFVTLDRIQELLPKHLPGSQLHKFCQCISLTHCDQLN